IFSRDKVSLCSFDACPGSRSVDQAGLELTEIACLCLPSAGIKGVPQYPEFSQEREKVTRTMEGRGKCLALGCLFVWKRLVPPDGLPLPRIPYDHCPHFTARE
uniref:Uncharacterized protein n=1 Tax=Peromyscus maniculatus bairdii TaxID=230844 RepID=A0A8C8URS2_PERMB